MTDDDTARRTADQFVRRRLHDANGQLSIAVLHLGMLLEDVRPEEASAESLQEALAACRAAAASVQAIWRHLDSADPRAAPGPEPAGS